MKAIIIREHGGVDALQIEDRPLPEPGPGEVRIRVHAVSLNHLDIWVRRGVPGHTFPLPLIPSSDASGVVDALGQGTGSLSVGQEVVVAPATSCGACRACLSGRDYQCKSYHILGESRDGVCAEYICIPFQNVIPKPANLTHPEAASSLLAFLTAWHMLVARAKVRPGERVLVHAGASGVGSAAIQIATLFGARVIATAGSQAKLELARELGAEETVNYQQNDFSKAVRAWAGREGVDIVFEHVGAATWDKSLRCLAWGGRLVTCGATTGAEVSLDLRHLFFKGWSLLGSSMGSRGELAEVLEHMARGTLRPVVDRVLPYSQVREAHELLEQRELIGKVVLSFAE